MQQSGEGRLFISKNTIFPPNNGAVHNTAQIIAVMSSATEVELGALFINAKQAAPLCQMLRELGHLQPPMPIQTNNSMAYSIVTHKIIPKAMKVVGMLFHWLCDHEQRQ